MNKQQAPNFVCLFCLFLFLEFWVCFFFSSCYLFVMIGFMFCKIFVDWIFGVDNHLQEASANVERCGNGRVAGPHSVGFSG